MSKHRWDLLVLSTAIGLLAAFAAPWLELRGTFQSWQLVEWHTFWRGESAFLLGDVVAGGYGIPVEFATETFQNLVQVVLLVGAGLGAWHAIVAVGLGIGWIRASRSSINIHRATFRLLLVLLVLVILTLLLTGILAVPSSRSLKVDFRNSADLHSSTLVWSDVVLLPMGPLLASAAAIIQFLVLYFWSREQAQTIAGGIK